MKNYIKMSQIKTMIYKIIVQSYSLIPKKVTPRVKDQVKSMVKSGMTYREIAKQIDISIKTISRIMTGYYDNKL